MAPPKDDAIDMEHRVTGIERDLASHIRVCERDGRETKYWVRFIGGALLLAVMKYFAENLHLPAI